MIISLRNVFPLLLDKLNGLKVLSLSSDEKSMQIVSFIWLSRDLQSVSEKGDERVAESWAIMKYIRVSQETKDTTRLVKRNRA